MLNPLVDRLADYPFDRLRALLDGLAPPESMRQLILSVGEPRHPPPSIVADALAAHVADWGRYPPVDGTPEFRRAVAGWLRRRYSLPEGLVDPDQHVLPVAGTREALFLIAQVAVPLQKAGAQPVVLMPNPFYQVYAVAALTAGAEPVYVPAVASNGFLPDFARLAPALLDRTAMVYICSPANPQGAVASFDYWAGLLALAEKHDFVVLADECYSEVWHRTAPTGVLEVAAATGTDPERVFAFHSLSKRSNMPGLRSGFVAGGPKGIAQMRKLRSFAGAPLPLPLQRVAERAWADEAHVDASRALYQQKFEDAAEVFAGVQGFALPEGGFFLWLPVEDGEAAALKLWRETGVRVLPGAYLSRDADGDNPGKGYIRVALVAQRDETRRGLTRLRDCLYA
jgi:succinyldiaminopimelate transaminase